MNGIKPTDVPNFFHDLTGGFERQLAHVLSDVASGVTDNDKGDGTVTIKLKLKRNAETQQVNITHELSYTAPTSKGSRSEVTANTTPMYVNDGGEISLFPTHTNQLISERA